MDVIIQMRNLCFRYPNQDILALKNINLEVKKGEFLVIAGKSGCGKSTLLYCLNGIIPHAVRGITYGSVDVCGLNPNENEIHKLATKVGMVFQNPDSQIFCDSVKSEIEYGIESNDNETVSEVSRDMDLMKFKNRHPHTLSRGERQRVAAAAILALQPDRIVCI